MGISFFFKNDRIISDCFQGKPFNITVIQVCAPTTNAEEVEVERFYKYLQDLLKEMGIPDHLICLLRNLYAGQEATVRTGHGTTDWFQIGKEYFKAVYCHPAYLTYMQSTS